YIDETGSLITLLDLDKNQARLRIININKEDRIDDKKINLKLNQSNSVIKYFDDYNNLSDSFTGGKFNNTSRFISVGYISNRGPFIQIINTKGESVYILEISNYNRFSLDDFLP